MSKEIDQLKSTIDQTLKQLHHEISFASKVIGVQTNDFNNNLQTSIVAINTALLELNNVVLLAKQQNTIMTDEFATFSLLPDKITNNIRYIVPQIAAAVEKIHQPQIKEVKEQFTALQLQLTQEIANYQHRFEESTNKCLTKMSTSIEKVSITAEEKLTQFANQLTSNAAQLAHDAAMATKSNTSRFFKNLTLILLFSALISGITSYLINDIVPKSIYRTYEIKSASDLSIHNSTVRILEATVLPAKTPKKSE